ncbi:futalosine hydrolase [Streptomyces laurentii]|uniref:futalosine hydrolase n=1 Tax=Streptomyces laurentii TaxID=39478 RepID=UPI0036AFAF81
MTPRILVVTAVAAEADSVATGLGHPANSGDLTNPGDPARPAGSADTVEPAEGAIRLPGGLVVRRHTAPGFTVDVLAAGVGPAAAAAATATALAVASGSGSGSASGSGSGSASGSPNAPSPDAPASGRPYDLVVSAGIAGGFAPRAPLGSVVVADSVVAADLGAQTPDGYLAVEELGFGRSTHPVAPALTARIARALADGGRPAVVGPVLTVSTVTGTAARAAELAVRHPGAAAEAMEGFGVAEAAAAYGVPVAEIRAVSNAVGPRDRAAWRIGEALAALRDAFRLLGSTVFVDPEGIPQ